MKPKGMNVPVSFRQEDLPLLNWADGQTRKKYLGLSNFSAVVRECIKIVRDNALLTGKDEKHEKSNID